MSPGPPSPTFDADGYPTEETLDRIRNWDPADAESCLEFCREAWRWSDDYWTQDGRTHTIATGGWSGNEDIVGALRENYTLWALIWQSSSRGGQHVFRVPDKRDP